MTTVHSITLRNDPAEVGRMMNWVDAVTESCDLSPATRNALQLCLEECVTNVVSHGFAPGTQHTLTVSLWGDDARVHAEVVDDGCPFDPVAHPLPAPADDLESMPIGGLGIKLMRGFAEAMSYRRDGALNRLLLSFSRAPMFNGMSDETPKPSAETTKRPVPPPMPKEIGGPKGPEPTRYGDWEVNGRCTDF